jgi:hypothetical protein
VGKKRGFVRMETLLSGFSVIRRNYGHWDISNHEQGRLFRIRGGPGKYGVLDERNGADRETKVFKTVIACMAYICDELMFELIVAEGQIPQSIESWNV